ncbi:carbohydrate ABC transporter permease [Nonomuraea fuscirosea]|uniref:Carbohydrate ABC transporter membrane protein 1 (CUT1 family) n=1 Tax=Nonomuraea fuscirosea TaxID=1291556 RepID=A0A2T0MLE6_9ACTN|nr:sugar ABC transporter permease [Nonomuraea fuscirosea]PRX58544.1 carbohydrate ABC transporter membrane protein 1 (CUT1 family) [Nonomuraea fuscirosea]WSA53358.1 sugar ABC transporter permease [Nonomuraea fuscirosea]
MLVRRARTWLPGLLLVTPSIVLIGVFVYGMLGWNFRVAMTDQHDAVSEGKFVGLQNFVDIWDLPRWHLSVNHAIMFTVVFVLGALLLGWLLAFLMEKGIRGEGTFRAIYLFPMAISFVATGIVWRWLMNSGTGERAVGLNRLFDWIGLPQWQWFRDPDWGMAAMALPAIWQMSGYVMALFLAGFRGVPEELREAARVDGCTEWGVYRHVVLPLLRPVTLSALIILGHISLKVFDLIVAVSGKQIITDVPAVFMWVAVFDSNDPAKGATIASYIVLSVAIFVIPYLVWSVRKERRS